MKKKIALVALMLVLLAVPAFSATFGGTTREDSVGVGLNLGTNTGVALRFGFGDFDVLANVGFDILDAFNGEFKVAGDAAVSWNYYTIDGGRALEFPLTFGVGANVAIDFSNDVSTDLSVIFPLGIEYNFAQLNPDVPITVYFRLAPGFYILQASKVGVDFDMAVYLGAIWNF